MRLIGRFLLPWEKRHDKYRNGKRVRRTSTRKRKRKERRQWQRELAMSFYDGDWS